jgi:dephospho-CoA kinase
MPVIGITGGVSTGKTTFCECLREIVPRAKFFDADQAAHELVDLDPEVRDAITHEFGAEIYSSGADLNRERLRAIVFADAAKKRALEQILHPRIRRQWSAEAQTHCNSPNYFFADIPLLYETGGETLCDRVVVVACSPTVQLARLRARHTIEGRASFGRLRTGSASPQRASQESRPPFDESMAEQIIKSQMPLHEKIARADHVVWNDGERAVLKEQAKFLVDLWREESWTKS